MTEEQIQNIILTKKYPFTKGEFFDHYSYAIVLIIIPVMSSYFFFIDRHIDFFLLVLSIPSLFFSILIFLYHAPKQREFEEIKIEGKNKKELYEMSKSLFLFLKWEIIASNNTNYILARRTWEVPWAACGQKIIVVIVDKKIYLISLYERNSQATFWKNRNHSNVRIFKETLNVMLQ